jgi:tetratricopeptide (TPR) repeat protein
MRRDWLLLVDDVADPSLLDGAGRLAAGTGWLRSHSSSAGLVLITTRIGSEATWGPGAVLHAVRPLALPTAAQVLLDHAGPSAGSVEEARFLARRLGTLPLALRMAGSYLCEVHAMPEEFREPDMPTTFLTYGRILDDLGRQDSPLRAVEESWRLSLDLLHRRGFPYAEGLLRVLAAFADAPIPHTLLLRPAGLMAAGEVLGGLDGPSLWRTLRELAALSLLDFLEPLPGNAEGENIGVPAIRLHPLIRDVSRAGTLPGPAVDLLGHAVRLPVLAAPEGPECWSAWQALAPHALHLVRHAGPGSVLSPAQQATILEGAELAGRYLQAIGLPRHAREEFDRILALREDLLGIEHPDTLTSRHNLAGSLHDLGDLAQARSLYQAVWDVRRRIQGEEHPSALTAQHELGRVLHDEGSLDSACRHLGAVLTARLGLLGEEHPHTMAARHELARVMHDQGDLARARQEYAQILAVRRKVLGEGHPRTLTVQHNYACVLHDQGDWQEAQIQLQQVREARQRVLGVRHPLTLSTQYRLGCVLRDRGDQDAARAMLQAVWEATCQTLGSDHPLTVKTVEALRVLPAL